MGRSSVARVRLKAKAEKSVSAKSGLVPKRKPKRDTGKPFTVNGKTLPELGGPNWKTFVKAVERECGLNETEVGWALEETARRTAGTHPTEDQVVGTFIEVVAALAPLTVNVRRGMVFACLDIHVRDVISGTKGFFSNVALKSGGLDLAKTEDGFALALDALPLSAAERASVAKLLPKPGSPSHTHAAAIDAATIVIVRLLEPRLIHARDTMIGGQKFVDRAVLLPLADGRLIMVMSEEYKAPKSAGGGVQSALRINRIFNANITPGTEFTYITTSDKDVATRMGAQPETEVRVVKTMGDVILSASTRGTDQLLVKASGSGRTDSEIASQSRSQKLVDAKREKGESLRRGKTLDVTFFKQYIPLPGRELRAVIRRVRRE